MAQQLYGQLQPRDGEEALKRLVNQMRRNLPGPAFLRIPVGPFNLLATGQTLCVPANDTGWVTCAADFFLDDVTGVQATGPTISIGASATFDEIVAPIALGAALVEDRQVALTLAAPIDAETLDIFVNVSVAASGPTLLTGMLYLAGYYR